MTKGVDLVQAAPQDFLAHPGNWMQWLSDYGATATAGPNFSWVLATRALKRMKDLDLSPLTRGPVGAEPVDPNAVEAFVAEASRFGFTPGGVFPAFGMAEVAIGGSFPPCGRGLRTDTVDRIVLETQPCGEAGRDHRTRDRARVLNGAPAAAARHGPAGARDEGPVDPPAPSKTFLNPCRAKFAAAAWHAR